MAKKVKLPLDMGNDVFVRTLDELKENYNTEKVTESFLDGRLLTWLNDRYYEDEAARVRELSEQGDRDKLAVKLGEIFGVKVETEVDIDVLEIRREKLEKLRRITSDDNILDNVDSVAFSQEELGDLLDEGAEVIYLCGGSFRIPMSVKNIRYIGVGNPVVSIGENGEVDLEANGISFEDCEFAADTRDRIKTKSNTEIKKNTDGTNYENSKRKIMNRISIQYASKFKVNVSKSYTKKDIPLPDYVKEPCAVIKSQFVDFGPTGNFFEDILIQEETLDEYVAQNGHVIPCLDENIKLLSSAPLCSYPGGEFSKLSEYGKYSKLLADVGNSYSEIYFYVEPEYWHDFFKRYFDYPVVAIPCRKPLPEPLLIKMSSGETLPLAYCYCKLSLKKIFNDIEDNFGKPIKKLWKKDSYIQLDGFIMYVSYKPYRSAPTKYNKSVFNSVYEYAPIYSTENILSNAVEIENEVGKGILNTKMISTTAENVRSNLECFEKLYDVNKPLLKNIKKIL